MKLGIIGLPQCGRSTIFDALTGARGEDETLKQSRKDQRIGTVKVMDERVDNLSGMYKPKKITYAQVEYLLPSDILSGTSSKSESAAWNQARVCDALIHVVRNFKDAGGMAPTPEKDFRGLEEEMILSDLAVAEKRIERIEADLKRGRKKDEEEYSLVRSCCELLEEGRPLRMNPELVIAPQLKGFTFLSAKPHLVIINNDEDNESLPEWGTIPEGFELLAVRGRLEMEIASMLPEEAGEFLVEYNIGSSALDRVIKSSYETLNLISFFTVGDDEVKAWTIGKGTPALEAAGAVHSDIQKGFIRAEVLAYSDLQEYGSFKEARKAGHVRLEGKEYTVLDGDIINFRFNV
ncbi:MAG: redox-regulated ATPase YchF [Deltaproteobacteria bacterium]|nr:redox-regulated ATPase YchF [Deltaproteobacteria bacterium]